jgi:hypothetical protein
MRPVRAASWLRIARHQGNFDVTPRAQPLVARRSRRPWTQSRCFESRHGSHFHDFAARALQRSSVTHPARMQKAVAATDAFP